MRIILLILLSLGAHAQILQGIFADTHIAPPANITQVGSAVTGASSDTQTATTASLTITGATLLVGSCQGTPSPGSGWAATDPGAVITYHLASSNNLNDTAIYYAVSAGFSGTTTLKCDGQQMGTYPSAILTAWSGTLTTLSALGTSADEGTTACATTSGGGGAYATSQAGDLVVCSAMFNTGSSYSISGTEGYAATGAINFNGGVSYGGSLNTVVQTSAGAVGTGTPSGGTVVATAGAVFKHP